jgi:NADH-quinone oxidoreductase subunit C
MTAAAGNTAAENVIKKLADKFGGSIAIERAGELTSIVVDRGKLREALLFLKTDSDVLFEMLTDLFAVDCYGREPRFEVVYLLTSLGRNVRLVVKTRVGDGEPVPTVSDIFSVADWLEREAYDMFGLRFEGHPNLTRILTVDDFDGHPLRKDFPTEGYGFDKPFTVNLGEEKADR